MRVEAGDPLIYILARRRFFNGQLAVMEAKLPSVTIAVETVAAMPPGDAEGKRTTSTASINLRKERARQGLERLAMEIGRRRGLIGAIDNEIVSRSSEYSREKRLYKRKIRNRERAAETGTPQKKLLIAEELRELREQYELLVSAPDEIPGFKLRKGTTDARVGRRGYVLPTGEIIVLSLPQIKVLEYLLSQTDPLKAREIAEGSGTRKDAVVTSLERIRREFDRVHVKLLVTTKRNGRQLSYIIEPME